MESIVKHCACMSTAARVVARGSHRETMHVTLKCMCVYLASCDQQDVDNFRCVIRSSIRPESALVHVANHKERMMFRCHLLGSFLM